jgi:F-type H+-transporting ATPase subunit a
MEALSIMPHYLEVGHFFLAQTLITGIFSTALFFLFLGIYQLVAKYFPQSTFVHSVESIIEYMINFFDEVGGGMVGKNVLMIVLFVFTYILRNNLVGLFGDWFALVRPDLHHVFRPVATDLTFNVFLAFVCVFGAIGYGFYLHGFHFIEKFIPYRGMGIVEKVNSVGTFIIKIGDIGLGLFIGFLETIGEFVRVISLSMRLFRNIFAGMIVMGIIVTIMKDLVGAPWLTPLIIFVFELMVSFIQAFVFSTLFLIYAKIASEGAH